LKVLQKLSQEGMSACSIHSPVLGAQETNVA